MKGTIAVLGLLFMGCGASAAEIAHRALVTGADASVAVDEVFAEAYQAASTAARLSSTTQAERDQKMAPWDQAELELEEVLDRLNEDLVLCERLLEAGDGFSQVFSRVLQAAREICELLVERGVPVPAALRELLRGQDGHG